MKLLPLLFLSLMICSCGKTTTSSYTTSKTSSEIDTSSSYTPIHPSSYSFSYSYSKTTTERPSRTSQITSSSSSSSSFISSSSKKSSSSSKESSSMEPISKNYPISFNGVKRTENLQNYLAWVKKEGGKTWNNDAVKEGVIKSPYYSIVFDKYAVPTYATNVSYGVHSFAYIIQEDPDVKLNITFDENINTCQILSTAQNAPEMTCLNNTIKLKLFDKTSYTLIPNGNKEKSLTVFIEPKVTYEATLGYTETIINPGRYETPFELNENHTLYFKSGYYFINKIKLNNNTRIFFEDGVYIEGINPKDLGEEPTVKSDNIGLPRYEDFITGKNISNVQINGHAILDFHALDFHSRKPINFLRCENVEIYDITLNNAVEWNTYNAVSKNINYNKCKIFGYRMNSDGYAFIDSQNCSVYNCFARSGDDLFEVKSMYGQETQEIKNISFDRCVGWPDKARGMGMISESKRPITSCTWKNSVICWYEPKWMADLGALVVIGESETSVEHSNLLFENIKICNNSSYPLNVTAGTKCLATIKNVTFKDIWIENNYYIRVTSRNGQNSTVDGVLFDNVFMNNSKITNSSNMTIEGNVNNISFK